MKAFLARYVLLVICACHVYGQSVQLHGSQLILPDGNIIGAAFNNNALIIQQSVLSAKGASIQSERHLLFVDLASERVTRVVTSPRDGPTPVGNRCGHVRVDSSLDRIFVCSNESTIAVLTSQTSQVESAIKVDGMIEDFVVDEEHHRLFICSQANSNLQYLSVYDSRNGKRLEEINISSGAIDGAQLALNSRTQRLGVAESRLRHSGYVTEVYGCIYRDTLQCDILAGGGQISQIAVSGNEILAASGLLADDRHTCLTQIDAVTKIAGQPYCSPSGVHYGVGALGNQYVIGYTGASKRLHFKEVTEPLNSSVSVWRVEDSKIAATATQDNYGNGFQEGVRIVGSNSENRFLLFSEASNIAYLYGVLEVPRK